ncbi:MAG: adenylyl-sulfate kinase [Rhizobiaceae bacterium]|nr:adenylyl-sulfate kinase [Rhizobiaceae bacterium]
MNNSQLEIIICGGEKDARARLASQVEAISKNHHIINVGGGLNRLHNMTTAAQSADLVIIAGGANNGFSTQSRQLLLIASVMGVQNFVLDIDETHAEEAENKFDEYLTNLRADHTRQLKGIVISRDAHKLADFILEITAGSADNQKDFRMPVTSLSDLGHIRGKVCSGKICTGDSVIVLPSATRTKISEIFSDAKSVQQIDKGRSAEFLLADNISVVPGDMLCSGDNPVEVADQFETSIVWLSPDPMIAGRPYILNSTTNTLDASITTIKHSINVNSHEHIAATRLEAGEIGVCNISLERNIPFEPIDAGRHTSQFTLYSKDDNKIVGLGSIHFALRRASNVHWQALDVTRQKRAELKGQKPAILWFTGLSGSGKSAIANVVEKKLTALGKHTYTLDGDNIRHGLNRDLGFTDADRVENIRRIAEVSRLMADSGIITLVSFISPFQSERQLARELAEVGEFIEIHVDTPLEVAEARDVKGLYKKARAGEIKNFTGIDSPYEPPLNPEIRVNTVDISAENAAENIIIKLRARGII